MSTLLSTCITNARTTLLESSARLWSDAELLVLANNAIKDLWAAVIDLYQDHIVTIDETNMSIAASANTITGVPADLFRIVMIQPRTLGALSSNPGLVFQPRNLLHPDFVQAQATSPVPPRNTTIFYAVINAGAPVGAPTIRIAPMPSSAVNLSVWYNPVIAAKIASDANPIPGESDTAITEYIIAFARAKEKEDRAPDAEHLSIYATEKRKILIALTPRSVQEPEVVEAFFQDYV
jgi:hypothetical protein